MIYRFRRWSPFRSIDSFLIFYLLSWVITYSKPINFILLIISLMGVYPSINGFETVWYRVASNTIHLTIFIKHISDIFQLYEMNSYATYYHKSFFKFIYLVLFRLASSPHSTFVLLVLLSLYLIHSWHFLSLLPHLVFFLSLGLLWLWFFSQDQHSYLHFFILCYSP